ncbi:MAG: lysyl oxidase family protein [Tepidisphaeraceae bacterium]
MKQIRSRRTSLMRASYVALFERLEPRTLLCNLPHLLPTDLARLARSDDGHILASQFLKARPQYAGMNLWSPATFNPTNSNDPHVWAYDPHWIEDDINDPVYPVVPPQTQTDNPEAIISTLPDLVPLTGGSFLNPFLDTTEIPGRNLLRFTTGIGNQGTGPAVLTSANSGTPPAGSGITSWVNADGTQNVLQLQYNYNTSTNQFTFDNYRPAGRMIWHNGHGHFHLEDYARYRLLTNVGGSPGPVAMRSDGAEATGDKIGFCLVNISVSFTMTNGQSSTTLQGYDPVGDQSHASNNGQPLTTCGFTQGIHVGHADVYSSIYDGQWIDVTGVPNGSYFLEVTLDAQNVIQETNDANNTVLVAVTLNANPPTGGIQPDRFEPNNEIGQATDLGELGNQTQSGLTIHTTDENDYFSFIASSSGSYQVKLNVGDRDVNLFLYNYREELIASSTGFANAPMTETVTANFVAGDQYFVRAQGFGSSLTPTTSGVSSNYALQVLVNPTVSTGTADSDANEWYGTSGRITLARNGPTSGPLTVNFNIAGTATRGADYNIYMDGLLISGNSVTIGNEASVANLDVRPVADPIAELPETVLLTVAANSAYVVGSGSGAVTIHDRFIIQDDGHSGELLLTSVGPIKPLAPDLFNEDRLDDEFLGPGDA